MAATMPQTNPPPWPADKIERMSPGALTAYRKNARTHSRRAGSADRELNSRMGLHHAGVGRRGL